MPFKQINLRKHIKFDEIESLFNSSMYIEQYLREKPADIKGLLANKEKIDIGLWVYDHIRQTCLELNKLIARLMQECNETTCPSMESGSNLEYLCASHEEPKQCCAIEYSIHTLNTITYLMNSSPDFECLVTINFDVIINILR